MGSYNVSDPDYTPNQGHIICLTLSRTTEAARETWWTKFMTQAEEAGMAPWIPAKWDLAG